MALCHRSILIDREQSGGEKQRVSIGKRIKKNPRMLLLKYSSIARAILKDARLVLQDEATSAVRSSFAMKPDLILKVYTIA